MSTTGWAAGWPAPAVAGSYDGVDGGVDPVPGTVDAVADPVPADVPGVAEPVLACEVPVGGGTVRSLKQYRHLMASSWISSAQYGHFFTADPPCRDGSWPWRVDAA